MTDLSDDGVAGITRILAISHAHNLSMPPSLRTGRGPFQAASWPESAANEILGQLPQQERYEEKRPVLRRAQNARCSKNPLADADHVGLDHFARHSLGQGPIYPAKQSGPMAAGSTTAAPTGTSTPNRGTAAIVPTTFGPAIPGQPDPGSTATGPTAPNKPTAVAAIVHIATTVAPTTSGTATGMAASNGATANDCNANPKADAAATSVPAAAHFCPLRTTGTLRISASRLQHSPGCLKPFCYGIPGG